MSSRASGHGCATLRSSASTLTSPELHGNGLALLYSADGSWSGLREIQRPFAAAPHANCGFGPYSFLVLTNAPPQGGPVKYVCIHGHFYQPPRENPYLEAIEFQDSAYPYHDWNERITAECYAPNAASRILDAENRIVKLVNNYAHISFNFGPTLLSWMKEQAPNVLCGDS